MSQGSGPPRRLPPDQALPRGPYRAPPHAQAAPGAFPLPGQSSPPPSWRPPPSLSRASAGVASSKRGLVVSRPSPDEPASPGLLAQGLETAFVYGDAAGEHLAMARGSHDASLYVWIAFLAEVVLLGCLPGMVFGVLAQLAGMSGIGALVVTVVFTLMGGAVPAWVVFRDRWCCIEAFSSRYCVSVLRVSLLYVPVIALVYANVRGVKKLAGR